MKLAIFDDYRLGVVSPDERQISDVTEALPGAHDADPLGAGWWVRLCRDLDGLRPRLEAAARSGAARDLADVRLRAPVLRPGKIVAAAANYVAHRDEMRERAPVGGSAPAWLGEFDVFLKAPSSIVGPQDAVLLPASAVAQNKEIHHESELAVIIGRGGADISAEQVLGHHVLGYTIGLDMTVRGEGDRSRRKSYDTFTPLGPWLVTADEVGDPQTLDITLTVNGLPRQQVNTSTMMTSVADLIAYASSVMWLDPGDVILTGAPPGVGPVCDGDVIETSISRIGRMRLPVRNRRAEIF